MKSTFHITEIIKSLLIKLRKSLRKTRGLVAVGSWIDKNRQEWTKRTKKHRLGRREREEETTQTREDGS